MATAFEPGRRQQSPLLTELREAADQRPNDAGALVALAGALQARGESEEAVSLFARAARLDPASVPLHRNWAGLLFAMSDTARAEEVLRKALAANPMSVPLAGDLAHVCLRRGGLEEAAGLFALAARRAPEDSLLAGLCECCLGEKDWRQVCEHAARWIGWPDGQRIRLHAGRALLAAGRLPEARECFEELLREDPRDPIALQGLGDLAYAASNFEEALRHHLAVYRADRENGAAGLHCLFDYLAAERYEEARNLFRSARDVIRSRWGHGPHYRGLAPEWDGRRLIAGKTILVHGAVGLGDSIQYSRFLRWLKELGAEVVLEVPAALARLMGTLAGAGEVVSKFDALPAIDFECDLRELFLLLDIPPGRFGLSVPYLFPDAALRRRWLLPDVASAALPRVGLVWSASGLFSHGALGNRSLPLQALRPVVTAWGDRAFPVCLQAGPARDEWKAADWTRDFVDPMDGVQDLLDTAALVSGLDVVVTIDTSVAHLAGAMGKQTLLMLPYSASWRWGAGAGESCWYPSVRMFRQASPGDWQSVVGPVAEALRDARRSRKPAPRGSFPSPELGIVGAPA